ncbi:MAG: DUF6765 family protein [Desulfovibrio sp.]
MQSDMHYYGTYAMAIAAGIPTMDAQTIAYAAQFVDDSTKQDSEPHKDGGLLYGIATAHDAAQCIGNKLTDKEEQRRVWVPFHFLPGADGATLEAKLVCTKNSPVAQEMMSNHIDAAQRKEFGLELMGIAAHVYMDTFSHYGFSGISSEYNAIVDDSLIPLGVENPEMRNYVLNGAGSFLSSLNLNSLVSFFVEATTGSLGHGSVATFPDRPFLEWKFEYEADRENGKISHRNNRTTFLEGCKNLYERFCKFANNYYDDNVIVPFEEIEGQVKNIIAFEGKCEERAAQWLASGLIPDDAKYDHTVWEQAKEDFPEAASSAQAADTPVYRFHQAAAYHRYYVLKDLLPKHDVIVY